MLEPKTGGQIQNAAMLARLLLAGVQTLQQRCERKHLTTY